MHLPSTSKKSDYYPKHALRSHILPNNTITGLRLIRIRKNIIDFILIEEQTITFGTHIYFNSMSFNNF